MPLLTFWALETIIASSLPDTRRHYTRLLLRTFINTAIMSDNVCSTIIYAALLGCQAGGYSYFAAFVNNELVPYFVQKGMESDAKDAHEVFVYLLVSAILIWIMFLLMAICPCVTGYKTDGSQSGSKLTLIMKLPQLVASIVLLVFACLTAQHSWNWWIYFNATDLEHLASNCHGIAAMVITSLVLGGVYIVMIAGVAIGLLTCLRE